jgi:uncharacterized membrane protein
MRGLLVGSLALNLLVIGGGVGLVATSGKHRAPQATSFSFGPFTRALAEEQKEEVRAQLSERMKARRHVDRQNGRRMMEALLAALRQAPFEPDAVRKIIGELDSQSQARRAQGTETLLEALTSMSQTERLAYVERLETDLTSKHKKNRGAPKKN